MDGGRRALQAQADHPAPVLKLAPKAATVDPAAQSSSAPTVTAAADNGGNSSWPLVISIVALVVAVAGVGLALRRRPGTAA
jgi:periplasmic copper chaperone A